MRPPCVLLLVRLSLLRYIYFSTRFGKSVPHTYHGDAYSILSSPGQCFARIVTLYPASSRSLAVWRPMTPALVALATCYGDAIFVLPDYEDVRHVLYAHMLYVDT